MRALERIKFSGKNSLRSWHRVKNPLIVVFNFILIYIARFLPSLTLKNLVYRLLGIKMGKNASVAFGVTFDFFFPELIEIGENSVIGYNSVILAHEFLVHEFRKGKVRIGRNVLIGANCTILPGVEIGDNATVSACSLVNKDVKENSFVGGVPIRILRKR